MVACEECGNETFSKVGGGATVCDVCGTESLAFTQEVVETENGYYNSQACQKVKRIAKKKTLKSIPLATHATFLDGFQAILQSQVITLITKFGCPLELKDLVWAMWSQLLLKMDKYQQSESLRETAEMKAVTSGMLPKIEISYGINFIALAILRQPIPLHVFVRHLKQGNIPFLTAFAELPITTDQRKKLRPLVSFEPHTVEVNINSLRTFLFGREFLLPPINFHGALRVMLEDLQLTNLYELCVTLWEMDQSPRIQPLPGFTNQAYKGSSYQVVMYIFIAFQLCFDMGREGFFEEGIRKKRRKAEGGLKFLEGLVSFEEWVVNFMKSEIFLSSGTKLWGTEQLLKRAWEEEGEYPTQKFIDLCMTYCYPTPVSKKHLVQGIMKVVDLSQKLSKELEEKTNTSTSSPSSSPSSNSTSPPVPSSNPTKSSSSHSPSSSSFSSSRKRKREKFPFEKVLIYRTFISTLEYYHPRMNLALNLFTIYIDSGDVSLFYTITQAALSRLLHRLNQDKTRVGGVVKASRTEWKKWSKKKSEVEWRMKLDRMAHRREVEEEEQEV